MLSYSSHFNDLAPSSSVEVVAPSATSWPLDSTGACSSGCDNNLLIIEKLNITKSSAPGYCSVIKDSFFHNLCFIQETFCRHFMRYKTVSCLIIQMYRFACICVCGIQVATDQRLKYILNQYQKKLPFHCSFNPHVASFFNSSLTEFFLICWYNVVNNLSIKFKVSTQIISKNIS